MTTKQIVEAKKWDFSIVSDSTECMNSLLRYADDLKANNLDAAFEPWFKAFNECPKASKAKLYTDGLKIVKGLYKKTKDEKYYDIILKIYDQRAQYFGKDKNYPASYLQGMKALDILTYKTGDEADKTAVQLFEESFKGDAKTVDPAFLQKYILSTVNLYKSGVFNAENVVNNYINAGNVITAIQNSGKTFTGKTDAEKAEKKEKFEASLASAKEQVDQILAQSGDESGLFFSTSELLHQIEPAASSARSLARMNIKKGDSNAAIDYYKQAIELEEENADKAKYYYEMATVQFSLHAFGAAKSSLYSAANLREGWGDPYILLGKVYAAGASSVGNEDWEKKAGYWAAVDKFAKAKAVDETVAAEANQLIGQYSQYFPTKEDLFMHGQKVGDSYTVGGFIGETTKIRAK